MVGKPIHALQLILFQYYAYPYQILLRIRDHYGVKQVASSGLMHVFVIVFDSALWILSHDTLGHLRFRMSYALAHSDRECAHSVLRTCTF